jgi:hypothetical protein
MSSNKFVGKVSSCAAEETHLWRKFAKKAQTLDKNEVKSHARHVLFQMLFLINCYTVPPYLAIWE